MAEKNDGIDWVGVAGGPWSTAEDLREYQKANKITIPLALDESGSLFRAFGIHDIPTIVLIDSRGKIAKVVHPDETNLRAAVKAAQGGT
jgi:peroxiredoxin